MASGILLLPLIILSVGAAQYGLWLVLYAVASFGYYADLGIGAAIAHFGSRARGGDSNWSLTSLVVTGVAWSAGALIVIAPLFWLFAHKYVSARGNESVSTAESQVLIWMSTSLLLGLVLRPFGSGLVGAGFLVLERRNQIMGVVVRVVGTLVACYFWRSVAAVAIVETIAILLPSLLSSICLRRLGLERFELKSISRRQLSRMLSYSTRSFAVSFVGASTLQVGTVLLGILGTPSQVTYYSAAFRIFSSVRQVLSWCVDPFRPGLSRLFSRSAVTARAVLVSMLFLSLSFGLVASIGLMILVPWLVPVWLGNDAPQAEVVATSQILLLSVVLNMVHVPLAPAVDAAGRPGVLFPAQTLWLIGHVALAMLLVGEYGSRGIALSFGLPLLVIEPLMLAGALPALGLPYRRWFREVLLPSVLIAMGGLLAVVLAVGLSSMLEVSLHPIAQGLLFILGCASTLMMFRHKLRLTRLRWALESEL